MFDLHTICHSITRKRENSVTKINLKTYIIRTKTIIRYLKNFEKFVFELNILH